MASGHDIPNSGGGFNSPEHEPLFKETPERPNLIATHHAMAHRYQQEAQATVVAGMPIERAGDLLEDQLRELDTSDYLDQPVIIEGTVWKQTAELRDGEPVLSYRPTPVPNTPGTSLGYSVREHDNTLFVTHVVRPQIPMIFEDQLGQSIYYPFMYVPVDEQASIISRADQERPHEPTIEDCIPGFLSDVKAALTDINPDNFTNMLRALAGVDLTPYSGLLRDDSIRNETEKYVRTLLRTRGDVAYIVSGVETIFTQQATESKPLNVTDQRFTINIHELSFLNTKLRPEVSGASNNPHFALSGTTPVTPSSTNSGMPMLITVPLSDKIILASPPILTVNG